MTLDKIIGRDAEKRQIEKLLASDQAEFLALYGRRRVGKTFFVREYLQNSLVFDISGSKSGDKSQQISNFFDEYLIRTEAKLETKVPNSWHQMFTYLARYLQTLGTPKFGKHVVFLDELPWMDTPKSEFIQALEFFWNQYASKLKHVLLIGCGSATSWIRKHLLQARGGLYNRVTARMKLYPFNLYETQQFIQSKGITLPNYQVLELYLAMGGIPFYLNGIENGKTATQLIDQICFSENGLLYDEYSQLYYSLFRNAELHITIIESLAQKPNGMTRVDIAKTTKMAEGNLARTLEELTECDFVTKFQAYQHKKKESIYKLTDFYSLFYLKFIAPNKGAGKRIWEQLSKQQQYISWSGYAFENVCATHIDQIKAALGVSGVYTQHTAWKFTATPELPGAQIDLVIDRADQCIHLCEAKFTKDNFVPTKEFAENVIQKKTVFQQATNTKKAVFFTLLSTYPALKNTYYKQAIDQEITMDALFIKI
jgi:uncharacterized protein